MYLDKIEKKLESLKNPTNAQAMKKYMKNRFEFLGIKTPERRKALREIVKANAYPNKQDLLRLSRDLWQKKEREYQYVAMDLLKQRQNLLEPNDMDLLEYLITNKSWWDTVDMIASNLLGGLIINYPKKLSSIEKWRGSDNLWLRRTTLLFQLKYKEKTDKALLFSLIRQNLGSDEFFINKAIGWALREYSKTDEKAVREFVASTALTKLSQREALKYVKR